MRETLGDMILMKRYEQVATLDPLNPYTRIRTQPAYGPNQSSGNGSFFFNPVSTEGIQQLAGGLGTPSALTVATSFGLAGLAAGLAFGAYKLWRR